MHIFFLPSESSVYSGRRWAVRVIAILAVAIGVLGFLYLKSRDVDTDPNVDIVTRLNEVEQVRSFMFAFANLLLCYIGYILLRVNRATEESKRELEQEVEERRRVEVNLRHAKEEAETASRAKSEFIANMSHELRTPLNAIIGFSEVINGQFLGPVWDQYTEYARYIAESGKHLLEVINDILDISRIESGNAKLEEERVEFRDIIDACINLIQGRLVQAKLTVDNRLPSNLPPLWADARKLKQIFLNLLSNAVKFTPEGGHIAIEARIVGDGSVVLSVVDTGIGMTPEGVAIALEPFGQVESSLSRKYEGTGLGLPLARSLSELHGATLEIDSEPGLGTKVSIRFPRERVLLDTS